MLRNYFKTAWRNLFRNKSFSLINILGLALGMACSLIMMLWVKDELDKDSFHEHDEYLFSVYERQYHDGQIDGGFYTPGLMADEMKTVLPEVEFASPFAWNELETFEANDKILKVEGNHAGEDFFRMFSFPLLQGGAATALKSPVDIAISRKMATDFFGSPEEAFGKSIRFNNVKDFKISAVFEDIGSNSSMKFDYLINWQTFLENNEWAKGWGNNGPDTFLKLQSTADPVAFEKKIVKFLDNYNKEQNENWYVQLGIQKFSKGYLYSNFKDGKIVGGQIQYVRLFTVVAVFILLIACINFMNLTTARSVKRAKEIGVRKVVGAFRGALIRQFIGEALMIVIFSFLAALLLVWLVLPFFNGVTRKEILLPFDQPFFWGTVACLTLATGLIAGSYPAFYLSSFNPVGVLKGALKFKNSQLWFRKSLVVFQFVLSIGLIISTIVVGKQVEYIKSAHLGYEREDLIYIPLEGDLAGKYQVLKEQALTSPGVATVSRITHSPTSIQNGTGGVQWEGKDPTSMVQFTQAAIGYDFLDAMKLDMAAGREYSKEFATDSVGYIVNETAARLFNYKDPIGMPLTFWGTKGHIVGVVKDFHFNSFHVAIKPLVLRLGENMGHGWALVRTEPGKAKEAIASLEKLCKELNPAFPFTYKFSDEEYDRLYKSEEIVSTLANGFAFLAIFISCLGLLGLAMFTAEQRTKEIGIRKVLGAPLHSLFTLLSKEMLLLVTLAIVIASPLAWYAMENWLNDYAYRTDISLWIFLVAGSTAIVIALATISFQTLKALFSDPVKSLRSE
jgi:putative ABC transport system permease protein